jgi:hypothetical protein
MEKKMSSATKWALGLGLGALGLGAGGYWARARFMDKLKVMNGKAQNLLAYFAQNKGVDMTGPQAQSVLVADFQKAYNDAYGMMLPKLRTDGTWDGATSQIFVALTGYTPPKRQMAAASGGPLC